MREAEGERRFPKYINSIFIECRGLIPEKEGEKEERVFCMERVVCAKEEK